MITLKNKKYQMIDPIGSKEYTVYIASHVDEVVEELKKEIMKKCSTYNSEDDMICDAEDYCLHCKDKFELINHIFNIK